MAIWLLVPPTFPSAYEEQGFVYSLTFYDSISSITGITGIEASYTYGTSETGVVQWYPLPSSVSASLVTYTKYQDVELRGRWPKVTYDSEWISRPSSSNTSTATASSFESVVRPYFAAQRYRADAVNQTSVVIRVIANYGVTSTGGIVSSTYGVFYTTQLLKQNYNNKRNQVIPFVQGGTLDTKTFKWPGGSLGGYVAEDLPDPISTEGLALFPVTETYTIVEDSGVFTVPEYVSSLTISLQAGGGQGGTAYVFPSYSASGGGGGGGEFVKQTISVVKGQQFAWKVGRGGDSTNSGVGEGSSFGNLLVRGGSRGGDGLIDQFTSFAAGGQAGGAGSNSGRPGTVGRANTQGVILDQIGGRGGDAVDPNIGQGGAGGDKQVPEGANGQPGTGFGGGGGGGGTHRGTQGPWPGADGSPGRIQLKYVRPRFLFNDIVAANAENYDVKTSALNAGWDGSSPLDATITINSGIYVYSSTTSAPAFSYAGIPSASEVKLFNNGYILGKGGHGGGDVSYADPYSAGSTNGWYGGPAIVLQSVPLFITNNGYIAGGGGGGGCGINANAGGSSGGGGGAGGGPGGNSWFLEPSFGWSYTAGGAGGGPGSAGSSSAKAWGGAGGGRILPGTGGAGTYVSGVNFIRATGGGAGGGGGGYFGQAGDGQWDGSWDGGGAGGAANNPGVTTTFLGAAGGGGWGAAGGSNTYVIGHGTAGGSGGKAIETNGYSVNFSSIGTIYGVIGGSGSGVFSTSISSNQLQMTLRPSIVAAGWDQFMTSVVSVPADVWIWSDNVAVPALTINGSWPNGLRINNYGNIIGKGGQGEDMIYNSGSQTFSYNGPFPGGPAMSTTIDLRIENNGYIAGGGGGGAAPWTGGGGAGGGKGGSYIGATYPVSGAAGGAIGQKGADAGPEFSGSIPPYSGGGGGGRILPGVGGKGFRVSYSTSFALGGGSGGGGSGFYSYNNKPKGCNGGDANQPGQSGYGGGGGGWGAAGGNFTRYGPTRFAGIGGKAIITNGKTITYFNVGAVWGVVS